MTLTTLRRVHVRGSRPFTRRDCLSFPNGKRRVESKEKEGGRRIHPVVYLMINSRYTTRVGGKNYNRVGFARWNLGANRRGHFHYGGGDDDYANGN